MYQIATDKISAMNKILINGIQSQRLSALLSSASVKHNDSPSDNIPAQGDFNMLVCLKQNRDGSKLVLCFY
ncbi:hypothetical protein B2M27_25950 [Kluyvera intermedia]|uniref:Uncharacterized protein n=2 Tax=Enterobacteriaceae TaxID=543 RepID=A0AAC8QPS0_9ENTR|nr:hypothetical protein AB182_16055 [Phytobacter ursingii]ORJ47438.1 hypothetical protein B2M27_25950 [Kluyvera intermedia]